MAEFTMPSLGADMDEGTLLEWLVKPGDAVRKGDVVAVVDTAKAAVEVECFDSGVVREILVTPGKTVPVGTPLAVIGTGDESPQPVVPAQAVPTPVVLTPPTAPPAAPSAKPPRPGPLVRRMAADLGVDLATVRGTGRGGAIRRADVQHAASSAGPETTDAGPAEPPTADATKEQSPAGRPARDERERVGRRRVTPYARRLARELGVDVDTIDAPVVRAVDVRSVSTATAPATAVPSARPRGEAPRAHAAREATARLMARSNREIPHYYLSTTIDLTGALRRLGELNRDLPAERRVLPVALMLKACALAAKEVPQLNGVWTEDGFHPAPVVNLGVAVALRGGGLVTPALQDAAHLGALDLMDRLRDVVARARAGRLRGSELTSATITVTNLGDRGVESVFGVIYPPQVALVGLGKVVERPWAVDGLLGVRPVVTTTLSADHRATDGHTGARYLELLDHLLNRPEEL